MNMYILFAYESITSNVIKDSRLCLVGIMRHLCSATQNLFINMNVYINDETYFQLRPLYAILYLISLNKLKNPQLK